LSSKTNSVVEVNGSRYDAISGRLLSPRKSLPGKKVIDGFTLGAHHKKSASTAKARLAEHSPSKAQGLHTRTQRSVTLMRKAVKQPAVKVISMADMRPQTRGAKPPHTRLSRAKAVDKHSKVERFGFMPQKKNTVSAEPTRIEAKASYRDSAVAAPKMPSMVTSASHHRLEQMLDEALTKADSHKQSSRRRRNRFSNILKPFAVLPRWMSLTLLVFIAAIIAFWLIWQNLPTVAVHVAAARAHVDASIPKYTPEGFSLVSPVEYKDGSVTMTFKEDKTKQDFALVQKASNWNSSSLVNNYIPANQAAQTSMVNGTTVYIYGQGGDAAWVNHGVLYDLKNHADLNSEQILKIVQGM
jgi:hypothetical protein